MNCKRESGGGPALLALNSKSAFLALAACLFLIFLGAASRADDSWPALTRQARPWAYWWWMGSAVDTNNLARELARYRQAGLGGVHIIPIYGAKGWESKYIPYLSPRWMEMLSFSVAEASRLDMGVDMTTGTGWCFGGPRVSDAEANASPVPQKFEIESDAVVDRQFHRDSLQALMAFGPNDAKADLIASLTAEGQRHWQAQGGPWQLFALSQKPSGQKVKRAAPGGEGWMLNPFYLPAMTNYLRWFDEAFSSASGPRPRAQYQDSYEYRASWSPDLFAQFERRRGYRLQDELPALFGRQTNDHAARVKCDYRETLSDLMIEESVPAWVRWSHDHGFMVRYEAHGAPGNLLDLYALADCPETELFHTDRDPLFAKFASSAAHVSGHSLASSETGTWLKEHFTETLADMKSLVDDFFLSGINHVFYHGLCYSPDEAGWPGWHFYASYEMNPRNPIWRDVSALNLYVARCQSLLQSGKPDNDVLLYWPVHDLWSASEGMVREFPVRNQEWFGAQPVGHTAQWLWSRGCQFDYVSDRQLAASRVQNGLLVLPGGVYKAVIVPPCVHIPLDTFRKLLTLADSGATVIFQDQLPEDVPGLSDLEQRRAEFQKIRRAKAAAKFLVGNLEAQLKAAHVPRETMADNGLLCVRRTEPEGKTYFIVNRNAQPFDSWLPLACPAESVLILDPMTGASGLARARVERGAALSLVRAQLAPGQSLIFRALEAASRAGPRWTYWKEAGVPAALAGQWQLEFIAGGPDLPPAVQTKTLTSWTALAGEPGERFAGTARYRLRFDAPGQSPAWRLDLGTVCQSARVLVNGRDLGVLYTPPFSVVIEDKLKPSGNDLEIEVTSVAANRIRDLDRRKVPWKSFHDINFVNIDYRPFDASDWPLTPCGLIGPVTLTPLKSTE